MRACLKPVITLTEACTPNTQRRPRAVYMEGLHNASQLFTFENQGFPQSAIRRRIAPPVTRISTTQPLKGQFRLTNLSSIAPSIEWRIPSTCKRDKLDAEECSTTSCDAFLRSSSTKL